MAEIQPEKMKGTTLDIAAENRARLKQLFSTVFTETCNDKGELTESIDFEKLKAELGTFSDTFESRRERYGMEWPGKKEALHLIQTLSSATLKPCRQESVNFDTTQNLFIEGDNLEVLKLLQTSYYGKVKMIYIDPPYNTGKEFIYPDNFSILLKAGFTLTGNIETKTITGKELFSVSDGALLLCLEESVTKELIDAVIDLNSQQFLCLDSAFHGNDQLKANAVQTFNAHNMQKEKHNQILFKTV